MVRRQEPQGASANWTEIRRRVDVAVAEKTTDPDEIRAVLEERARALARPASAPATGGLLELITFSLADEVYAIESRYVMGVFRLGDFSPLPGAEAPVVGLTTWRGALLTLLDLRRVLGLSVAALNDLSRVVAVGEDRPSFGILADSARDILRLRPSELHPLPERLGRRGEYLRGVSSNAVLMLDAEQLLRSHA